MNREQTARMTWLFDQADIKLSPEQKNAFMVLYDMLTENSDRDDLTRLRSFDDIIIKHFIDSVYFTKFITLPSSLVDIGTGPGFPGIPLKIMNPDLHIILAEPRVRRVEFMRSVIKRLNLKKADIYPHMVTDKSFFETDGVITRALETVDGTLTRTDHFLLEGGKILFMKGPEAGEDLKQISEKNRRTFRIAEDRKYTLPGTGYARRILVFEKTTSEIKKAHVILKNQDETLGIPVTSPDNKTFRELKKLTSSQGMKKAGAVLLSGKKIVAEALKDPSITKHQLILMDGYREKDPVMNSFYEEYAAEGKLFLLKPGLFHELDIFGTDGPLLCSETPLIPEWTGSAAEKGCWLLVPFQDPKNVGTVIRCAAGFDAAGIILLKESANPFHPGSVRASSGTVFHAPLFRGPSITDFARMAGQIPVVALDRNGTDIGNFEFPETFYLMPGIEGPGLPEEMRSGAVSIPLNSSVESLNGAVAASIAIYEWKRRSTAKLK